MVEDQEFMNKLDEIAKSFEPKAEKAYNEFKASRERKNKPDNFSKDIGDAMNESISLKKIFAQK